MSFTNPCSGKVAGTTTITATEANAIGVNSARAVDGTNGGTYTPTAQLIIQGTYGLTVNGTAGLTVGSDNSTGLASCRVTGPLTLAGNTGRIAKRISVTNPGDADTDITAAADIWLSGTSDLTASRTYTLRHTGAVTPATGNEIHLIRRMLGAFPIVVVREDLTIVWQTNNAVRTWAKFLWNGTDWITYEWESSGTAAVLTF